MPNYVVAWERSAVVSAESEEEAIETMAEHLSSIGVEHDNVHVVMTTSWPAELVAESI